MVYLTHAVYDSFSLNPAVVQFIYCRIDATRLPLTDGKASKLLGASVRRDELSFPFAV